MFSICFSWIVNALVLVVTSQAGAGENPPLLIASEEFEAALQARLNRLDDRLIEFSFDSWTDIEVGEVPDPSTGEAFVLKCNEDTWMCRNMLKAVRSQGRYAIWSTYEAVTSARPVHAYAGGANNYSFDGSRYRTQTRSSANEEAYWIHQDLMLQDPPCPPMNVLGWWVFGWRTFQTTYGEILTSSRVVVDGPRLAEDGRTTEWVISNAGALDLEVILRARRNESGLPELVESETRSYEVLGFENPTRGRLIQWQRTVMESGGPVGIGQSAEFYSAGALEDEKQYGWSRVSIRIVGISEPSFDPEVMKFEPAPRAWIHDKLYGIAYRLGGQQLALDGRSYTTHEPMLDANVGDRLEWWIANATSQRLLDSTTNEFVDGLEPGQRFDPPRGAASESSNSDTSHETEQLP